MECFTFRNGKITPGISVEIDKKFGPVVELGEKGPGRVYAKVPFLRKDPAEIMEGETRHAYLVKIDTKETSIGTKSLYAFAKPNNTQDSRIILRINTKWRHELGAYGGWTIKKNRPKFIVSGYGAHGKRGELGGWLDSLVILSLGDEIYIKTEGGSDFIVVYRPCLMHGLFLYNINL